MDKQRGIYWTLGLLAVTMFFGIPAVAGYVLMQALLRGLTTLAVSRLEKVAPEAPAPVNRPRVRPSAAPIVIPAARLAATGPTNRLVLESKRIDLGKSHHAVASPWKMPVAC